MFITEKSTLTGSGITLTGTAGIVMTTGTAMIGGIAMTAGTAMTGGIAMTAGTAMTMNGGVTADN